jgi:hypothetical protein
LDLLLSFGLDLEIGLLNYFSIDYRLMIFYEHGIHRTGTLLETIEHEAKKDI